MATSVQLFTVLDTNAYIGLSREKIGRLTELEAASSVVALAATWPCLELLAHCASPDSALASRAHAAIQKLAVHSGYVTPGGEQRLRVHEAGDFVLARGLFGMSLDEPMLELGLVGNLVAAAATASLEELRLNHAEVLASVAVRVREEEDKFLRFAEIGISAGGVATFPPSPTSIEIGIVAAGLVQAFAERLGMREGSFDRNSAARLVVDHFKVALAFMYALVAESSAAGTLVGGGNSAWDLKMAFHASRGASLSGVPVLVVSNDRRLLRAARDADQPLRVVSVADYLSLLLNPTHVVERAALLSIDGGAR